eukprot:1091079-Amphidinium_carterae.2
MKGIYELRFKSNSCMNLGNATCFHGQCKTVQERENVGITPPAPKVPQNNKEQRTRNGLFRTAKDSCLADLSQSPGRVSLVTALSHRDP